MHQYNELQGKGTGGDNGGKCCTLVYKWSLKHTDLTHKIFNY